MTDELDRDLLLEFAKAEQPLKSKEFTTNVMRETQILGNRKKRSLWLYGLVLLALCILFAGPLVKLGTMFAIGFISPLVSFENPWLATLTMPVNNIASIVVAMLIGGRFIWKKASQ